MYAHKAKHGWLTLHELVLHLLGQTAVRGVTFGLTVG